ncbi:MAG: hypothetical protein RMJ00_06750 [Nitrososphaerota archaeon]|nr:hypothetical protein [Candidatus Bathyarchaeota archaeon]MDW8062380.1 hypothetical protein [Nitrososphaerota archaeon]
MQLTRIYDAIRFMETLLSMADWIDRGRIAVMGIRGGGLIVLHTTLQEMMYLAVVLYDLHQYT